MSTFHVTVLPLDAIEPHPNADKLELAVLGGYRAVVAKGLYAPGEPVIYIPADSIVPPETAARLGIETYLAGAAKNRVKAIRLRGILSEGIVLPLTFAPHASVGDHLEAMFGITKYEEPIPTHMNGRARPWPTWLPKYDIENVKHPACRPLLNEREPVFITEKLHGANIAVAVGPGLQADEPAYVCSRGVALVDDPANLYWVTARKHDLIAKVTRLRDTLRAQEHVALYGEVLGCQDLRYGHSNGNPGFAAFDIRVDGRFLNPPEFFAACESVGIPIVPLLYSGPFAYDELPGLACGPSRLAGHMREGVVIKPAIERYASTVGRVAFKYMSEEYLTRRGGSEYR